MLCRMFEVPLSDQDLLTIDRQAQDGTVTLSLCGEVDLYPRLSYSRNSRMLRRCPRAGSCSTSPRLPSSTPPDSTRCYEATAKQTPTAASSSSETFLGKPANFSGSRASTLAFEPNRPGIDWKGGVVEGRRPIAIDGSQIVAIRLD